LTGWPAADSERVHGDLGVIYPGIQGAPDQDVLNAAMALTAKGEITPTPVRSAGGYSLLELVSTSDDHPADEDRLYADAAFLYRERQGGLKSRAYAAELRSRAHIVIYAAQ
jgi:hypothetical protein